MYFIILQYNTIQYYTVQSIIIKYSTVMYSTLQYYSIKMHNCPVLKYFDPHPQSKHTDNSSSAEIKALSLSN